MGRRTYLIMLVCIMCASIFLFSCQATPQERAITEKDDGNLRDLLQSSAQSKEEPESSYNMVQQNEEKNEEVPVWNLTKEFDSGATLIIEAPAVLHGETNAPVASVQEKPFTQEQCEEITRALYPDAKICDYEITQETMEQDLLYYKEMLHKAQTDPDYFKDADGDIIYGFGLPESKLHLIQNGEILTLEEELTLNIEDLEERYPNAPSLAELETTEYEFKDLPESEQINLVTFQDRQTISINFVNWSSGIRGSEFILSLDQPKVAGEKIIYECVSPSFLDQDSVFSDDRTIAEECLRKLGVDYMGLQWVTKGESALGEESHTFCYMRIINEFPETHTPTYLGTLAFDTEYEQFRDLWKYENIQISVKNGTITSVHWQNPAEVTVENENVQIISWEEAQEIFLKQMDRLLSPNVSEEDTQLGILGGNKEFHINRIELGLTKILMADNDEYKLIPTWTFSGYEKESLYNNPEMAGALICFVTVNAVDGTIIDRGLMY